ncbi:hypothetical protein F4782DRAFT_457849 [Xylaria castorea]|nr:hypothetical protein F4782DRAFT_457849 [Xylaria castorea]
MAPHRPSVSSTDSVYSARDSIFSHSSATSMSTSASAPDIPTAQFAAGGLFCEFVGYSHCERSFALDDVDRWIEHVISVHLQGFLPKKVICWFCDHGTFDDKDVGDRRVNFDRRMWHIRDHILYDGLTAHHMRPDHFLNAHLEKHRLIPESAYHHVRRYAEVPQGNWILPHDGVPADWEDRNSRGDYEVNNPLEEQRKSRKHRHKSGKSRK